MKRENRGQYRKQPSSVFQAEQAGLGDPWEEGTRTQGLLGVAKT